MSLSFPVKPRWFMLAHPREAACLKIGVSGEQVHHGMTSDNVSIGANQLGVSRRGVVAGTAALAAGLAGSGTSAQGPERPNPILGHAIATIGVPDVPVAQRIYEKALGLTEANRGVVSERVATAWGAPAMQGRPWVMMRCESGDPSFHIRIVQVDPVPGYRAMATWGLNAIEMISSDIYAVNERALAAGLEVIGEPRPLSEAFASVHAMQVKGPGEEVFYFASDVTGENEFSLIEPQSLVDRMFNAVVGTPNITAGRLFYSSALGMDLGSLMAFKVRMVADALGYSRDRAIEIGGTRGRQPGSAIELDAYPVALSGPRPRAPGQLPSGVSMISLATDDFDAIKVSFIAAPQALYGGGRVASCIGPAGEWIELIETEVT
jgi:catechol 2,3-dioxygenase-like lactoylglutathione lyase family enzyme